jgi:Nitrogen permease regulator 2
VKQCIQHLRHFGIVEVFDLFQFTNRYIAGENLPHHKGNKQEVAVWTAIANAESVQDVILTT